MFVLHIVYVLMFWVGFGEVSILENVVFWGKWDIVFEFFLGLIFFIYKVSLQATRYNYNSVEKFAVVELIAMTKGLQRLMLQMESTFMDGIRRHIYRELQTLVQHSLRRTLRRSVKHKHDVIHVYVT